MIKITHPSPARVFLLSIIGTIVTGALLLSLPMSRITSIPFLDNLFTAVSATTVTGLNTISIDSYTFIGKCIILLLIQIGGLGLITMTLFTISLFTELAFGTQLMIGKLFELESWHNMRKLLFFIIGFTALCELIGALCIFLSIRHEYPLYHALFYASFQSVSAFCNAGFYIFPQSFYTFQHYTLLLATTAFLSFSGGLGFLTWHEIMTYMHLTWQGRRATISLHSKIVLFMTAILTVSCIMLYWALERNNTLQCLSSPFIIINAIFNAISCRSAGFSTVPVEELQFATLFMIMLYAFIGSSPASTGSGIKVTTFAIFAGAAKTAIEGKSAVELKGRRIARDQLFKALAIIILGISWIIITTFCLLITEKGWEFLDIIFEVVSAFSTLGFSTGVTPYLSVIGKIFIILTMIIGRLGSLTMVLALRKKTEQTEYTFPEERIMLG